MPSMAALSWPMMAMPHLSKKPHSMNKQMQQQADFQFAIIGTGFAGLGAAIRLKQSGYHDMVLFERAGAIGGTWRDNTYPGCACDIPSHLYSFSFAPNPNWSEVYSRQPEIWAYLQGLAERYQLLPSIRFNHNVEQATWDEQSLRWRIHTSSGEYSAQYLLAGYGPLAEPRIPEIPGIETFRGTLFHSARWDHTHDLTGKQVAVIGTGASVVQFVPEIQPIVDHLTLFQRTPAWVVPRMNRAFTLEEQQLFRQNPLAQRWERYKIYLQHELGVLGFRYPRFEAQAVTAGLNHLAAQVPDPALREKLTPHYGAGCKRITVSDDYYPALSQPNVTVVTDAIHQIRGNQIITADGSIRSVDTLILGTGFLVTENPSANIIRGRDGRSLAEIWQGSPEAYVGTTVANFPNLFLLVGPNTGLGHNSIVFMIEAQLHYLMSCLSYLKRQRLSVFEVQAAHQQAYNAELQQQLKQYVWHWGKCHSWYLDKRGRNTTLWPGFTFRYYQRTRRFDPRAYYFQRG
jgi:cation diffusion facilitator CzcD-associated flavoprotein CzcO